MLQWSGETAAAAREFETELGLDPSNPRLAAGFLQAAADAGRLTASQSELAARLYRELGTSYLVRSPVFAARFGRVLQLAGRTDEATALFAKAVANAPLAAAAKRELAGVLSSAGRIDDAITVLGGANAESADLAQLATLQAGRKDWKAAEAAARANLRANPNDAAAARLVADVLSWSGRYEEALADFAKLRTAHPDDLEIPVRIAEVRFWSRDVTGAAAAFADLLSTTPSDSAAWQKSRDGFAATVLTLADPPTKYVETAAMLARTMTPAAADAVPLTAARLAAILSRANRAVPAGLADKANGIVPADDNQRRELAAVFAALGRRQQALDLYRGVARTADDTAALAGLFAAANDFVSAERVALDAVAENPRDIAAQRLLADILSWKKDYKGATAAYQKLIEQYPEDASLRAQLAQVLLWNGDYVDAATRYEAFLTKYPDRLDLTAPFFAALAAADPPPTPAQARLAEKLADLPANRDSKDAGFLSNIAWVLHRVDAADRAKTYLDAAVALDPTDAQTRKNLAGVLQVFGRVKDALKMFEGLTLTEGDRFRLAGLFATDRQYDKTEEMVRSVLARDPGNVKALRLLADVLSWNEKYRADGYRESLELFAKLQTLAPTDREIPVRIAEVNLWAGNFDRATDLFGILLTDDFDRPSLWSAYIDSAASEKQPSAAEGVMAARIYTAAFLPTKPPVKGMYPFPPADPTDGREVRDGRLPTRFLSRLAWVLFQTNSKDKATTVINAAVARKPSVGEIRREIAGVLSSMGRFGDARKMYEGIAGELQTWVDVVRMAELDSAEGAFTRAADRLARVVRDHPDEKLPALLLADVLIWGKQYREATRRLDDARRRWPGDPAVEGRAAAALGYGGNPAAAVPLFVRLLEKNLDQPTLWQPFLDAVAAAPAGTANAALVTKIVQKLETTMAENPERVVGISLALARVGQGDRAIAGLRRALAVRPESQVLRRRLAETLSALGRTREAEVQFEILLRQQQQPASVVGP
ncbi:MAG: tetratricopeptide repeat protein [Fimbriiglobus sp.]